MSIPSARILRVGTRGSQLARAQTALVIGALQRANPGLQFEVQIISTHGDESALAGESQFDGQGAFVRRIESALQMGTIDLAVHSYKDMPSTDPDGLVIAAFPVREDPRDALVARSAWTLATLPRGAVLATGSPRRRALVHALRPDVEVRPIRGNVDTRVRQVIENEGYAAVLAVAGLRRLGRAEVIRETLDPAEFVPAVGQGILAVQARASDAAILVLLSTIDDPETRCCAIAERGVAGAFGADCQTALGAYARQERGQLILDAFVAPQNANALVRAHRIGPPSEAANLGHEVGAALRREATAHSAPPSGLGLRP